MTASDKMYRSQKSNNNKNKHKRDRGLCHELGSKGTKGGFS